MKSLVFWLLPVSAFAGHARYARVGDFDGAVQVQLTAADDWQPARRNLPVGECSWLRTEGSARVEVELDEGSILRLGPDSLAELSDYTRLSTGQRITLISLDHGLFYFTGAAEGKDSLVIAVPGAQVTIHQGARLRLEARDPWSLIAAVDGAARFSSPTAEFDLTAGQMVKLDPAHPARFFLNREIPALEADRWSDERDQVLLSTTSAAHVPALRYGLADLDASGAWIDSHDFGTVWKPKVPPGWTPFRNGKWLWYDGLGYTWIADDPWGWLPYHYGRWLQLEGTAWVWAPGAGTVFKPGEVYWMKSARLAGWGALAPGENWQPPETPRQYLTANTTFAGYTAGLREIDPASFTARPDEPLKVAVFAQTLPSPLFPSSRLDAFRPPLRASSTRTVSVSSDAAFDSSQNTEASPASPPSPADAAYANAPPAPPRVVSANSPPEEVPQEVDVPVPVYTGIIVLYPPRQQASKNPAKSTPPSSSGTNNASNAPPEHQRPKPKRPDSDKP